mmetsp:Transcript_49109/g.105192  ORF Transcript_49109/g.105192 Transcript_49109/m.105192 type:complete len:184 (+) Transcript_49109:3-554(+)
MATETWQGVRYPVSRAQGCMRKADVDAEDVSKAKPLLRAAAQRVMLRSFFNFLRSGMQVQLQITLLAVARGGAHESGVEPTGELQITGKILLSVAVGLANMAQNIAFSGVRFGEIWKLYRDMASKGMVGGQGILRRLVVTNCCMGLNAFLLLHALLKLWSAFHCPYAVWDFNSGCVDESECFK